MSGSCCPNLCPECGLVYHNATVEGCLRRQVADLRAEVAKYRGMEVEDAGLRNDSEALRAEVAALKADLAGYQEANHAVAVCRNHTNDIITRDGCVICDLARYTAPLTEDEAIRVLGCSAITGTCGADVMKMVGFADRIRSRRSE